jgi:hypothetical protein
VTPHDGDRQKGVQRPETGRASLQSPGYRRRARLTVPTTITTPAQ